MSNFDRTFTLNKKCIVFFKKIVTSSKKNVLRVQIGWFLIRPMKIGHFGPIRMAHISQTTWAPQAKIIFIEGTHSKEFGSPIISKKLITCKKNYLVLGIWCSILSTSTQFGPLSLIKVSLFEGIYRTNQRIICRTHCQLSKAPSTIKFGFILQEIRGWHHMLLCKYCMCIILCGITPVTPEVLNQIWCLMVHWKAGSEFYI